MGGIDNTSEPVKKERKPRQSRIGAISVDDQLARIEGMLRGGSMLAIGISARINENDAVMIAAHTTQPVANVPNIIDATMELCRNDPKVRAYLFGFAQQSAYLNLAVACASLTFAVLQNHKLVPPLFVPQPPKVSEEKSNNGVSNMA